jgi:hypothetical protein
VRLLLTGRDTFGRDTFDEILFSISNPWAIVKELRAGKKDGVKEFIPVENRDIAPYILGKLLC